MREQQPLGSDGLAVRDSGEWAKEKLYYLEHYLDIFSVGMRKKWAGKLYYVDLFAGPGRCRVRETNEEIDGSPLVALKFNFAKCFFFEADPACYTALVTRVKTRSPEKNVEIIRGDCNKNIHQVKPPTASLGVAFIDPTGVSPIAFETIRRLTLNRKIDLIINFHEGMGIRMNIHQYIKTKGSALDTFMGSDQWRQRFKRAPSSISQVCREITNEYQERLRELGYGVVDSDRIPVKTDRNALLYYLVFASKNARGNEFWHKIKLIDPHGQKDFGF
jgi:three-Cys-motif partner protein